MCLRWLGWLVAVSVVCAACGSSDGDDWAEEAEFWHEDLRTAHLAEGGEAFARFLAPDVVWDDSAILAETIEAAETKGALALLKARLIFGPESLVIEPDVFVDTEGLVDFIFYDWAPLGNDFLPETKEPAHGVGLFTPIGPSGAEALVHGEAIDDWRDRRPGSPQADEAEAVATIWTQAWSGTTDHVDTLYHVEARLRDSLSGIDATGRDAIAERAREGGTWTITTVGQDAVRGVYPLVRDTSSGMVLQEVVLVVAGEDDTGCAGEMVVWLTLDAGIVAKETRYWPIERARRCIAADDLPSGWWIDHPISPPETVPESLEDIETPTDPLVIDGATIVIYNGTPALNRLLSWGLDRFEAAGLSPPSIASATFTLQSEFCDDVRGRYRQATEGADLAFCFDEDIVCRGDACQYLTPASRSLVLHELAHAWIDNTLDEDTKRRFSEHVGLETWNDKTVPWVERAVEHAADTIAWGLMDREILMSRLGIPSPTPDHLATGFGILAGTQPLPRTDQRQSTPDQ